MEIVIKIEDYDREWIANGYYIPDEINEKIAEAIIDGIPYNPTGDCISREALKTKAYTAVILEPDEKGIDYVKDKRYVVDLADIDNAPTVQQSILPLSSEADNAYMRGYEVGKVEGILRANKRPQGEWKKLYGNHTYCSKCKKDCEQNHINFCGYCGADMR